MAVLPLEVSQATMFQKRVAEDMRLRLGELRGNAFMAFAQCHPCMNG